MIIVIAADCTPELRDPDDFRRFHIESAVPRARLPELRRALAGAIAFENGGEDGGKEAWVLVDWLRAQGSAQAATPERPDAAADRWRADLDAMIAKARPHGWVRETPEPAIKAHINWP